MRVELTFVDKIEYTSAGIIYLTLTIMHRTEQEGQQRFKELRRLKGDLVLKLEKEEQ